LPDNGSGTVDLPPAGCAYLSPTNFHEIVNGLPPNTKIIIAPEHRAFLCPNPGGTCETAGGPLGGTIDGPFNSELNLILVGTGDLSGFRREILVGLQCEVHTGPRTPGAPVQAFPTDMAMLQGGIIGDPDFDLLQVTGGTSFGMPSPGHTTLTRLGPPGSDYQIDSFFDISYRIDFVGAPGGALGGMSGSTTGTIRMVAQQPGGVQSVQFCDDTDGAHLSCPCANPGNPGSGCDSPVPVMQGGGTTGGIRMDVIAQQTAPQNRATITGTGYPTGSTPGAVVIRAAALDSAAPVVFGDGLRCVGTPLVRLAGATAAGGFSFHLLGHSVMSGSGLFYYQLWYRSQPASYCDPLADYNLSNGRSLIW
jgi:hypothetical protein